MSNDKIGKYWDQRARTTQPNVTRWWQSGTIVSHINRLVCGRRIPGLHAGFHELLKEKANGQPFARAVSVGSGLGGKELSLVRNNVVGHFQLFELSAQRIELGRAAAEKAGVGDRMHFRLADAFETSFAHKLDLVYWNNSLHHMMDAEQALIWSRENLRPGGTIAMDDFTGPTRFQWTDANLEFASRVREALPDRLLANPASPGALLPRQIKRPDPTRLAQLDPSEAADSGAIIDAWARVFPNSRVIPSGGAIYNLALNDAIANFTQEDSSLLEALLLLDQSLAGGEMNHYTVAISSA